MPRVLAESVLIFALLVACSEDPAPETLEGAVRKADASIRIGDVPIYQGRISWADDVFEFRACNRAELYFIDASFSINDTLDHAIQSQSAVNATPIYVRFHGEVMAGVDGLPDRYTDVVRIA